MRDEHPRRDRPAFSESSSNPPKPGPQNLPLGSGRHPARLISKEWLQKHIRNLFCFQGAVFAWFCFALLLKMGRIKGPPKEMSLGQYPSRGPLAHISHLRLLQMRESCTFPWDTSLWAVAAPLLSPRQTPSHYNGCSPIPMHKALPCIVFNPHKKLSLQGKYYYPDYANEKLRRLLN